MIKNFSFVLLFFLSNSSQARIEGAVTSATAGSGVAAVDPVDSANLNPAALAFTRGYVFTSSMTSSKTGSDLTNNGYLLALVDNLPETVVPTAFAFTQSTDKFQGEIYHSERDFRLSSGNSINNQWAYGLGVNYKTDEYKTDKRPDITKTATQINLHTGVMWTPTKQTGLGLVFRNFVGPDNSVPDAYRLNPETVFGYNYNYKKFLRLKADIGTTGANSFGRPKLGTGMEMYMNRWLVMRMGAGRNMLENSNAYGVGVGFLGPKFALNYAFSNDNKDESLARHTVDLAVPIW